MIDPMPRVLSAIGLVASMLRPTRRAVWLLLVLQGAAFAAGIVLLAEPPPPPEIPNLAPVITVVFRTLAVLGFSLTILAGWLFVPASRGFRWIEVAVEFVILLIATELLQAQPRSLSWLLWGIVAFTLTVLSRSVISERARARRERLKPARQR